jgi:hypothetical protein
MTPNRPERRGQVQPVLAVALGLAAVIGIVAAIVLGSNAPAGARAPERPSSPPLVVRPSVTPPSVVPTAAPSATPTVAPSAPPVATPAPPVATPATGSTTIALRNASGHAVKLQIHDETGTLGSATSGTPGDGMSVRWHDAIVKNAGSRTIHVTWAGLPGDDVSDLNIAVRGGKLVLTFVQPGPLPYTDAMGEDRILSLTFDDAVSPDDVVVKILDRSVD